MDDEILQKDFFPNFLEKLKNFEKSVDICILVWYYKQVVA